ncbi:MAG TPA: hypothetical protein VFO93_06860 [Hymenobacter sp.]|uniref:hypothetical protein n=1 Tax=Hymenobacter sp. TaxID=1898978 RepID=UPI002D808E9E|nr:hypothetical protein [Hymenobacter sp.]HET9503242.1 hypothetical protein [Hymenobacter sp.]
MINLEIGQTYLIDWGKTTSELHILEITADGIRGTLVRKALGTGAWYFRKDIEARVIKQLAGEWL